MHFLQQPLQVRGVHFKNRIMVGPMSLGSLNEYQSFANIQKFYQQLCINQVSSITMGGFSPDQAGRYRQDDGNFFDLDETKFIQLNRMLESYGVVSICQLLHVGQFAVHNAPVSTNDTKAAITGLKVHPLSSSEIQILVEGFASAAKKSYELGFSGVELNAAEGFLLNELVSLDIDERSDGWGKSSANKFEKLKEIVAAIRKVVPDQFLISLRIGADRLLQSASNESSAELAELINELDIDLVTPVFGQINDLVSKNSSIVPEGYFLKFYQSLRLLIQKPIVANQRISEFNSLQSSAKDLFDFVAMARPFLADPQLVQKFFNGRESEINQCLACNQLCINRTFQFPKKPDSISCLINPFLNFYFRSAGGNSSTKAAVIGGGILGLQATYALLRSGYEVTLFEKSKKIGGVFADLSLVPTKKAFPKAVQYLEAECRNLGANIILNQAPSLDSLGAYQIIFNATNNSVRNEFQSAVPILKFRDVLLNPSLILDNIVIIGGGGVGLEIAEFCHIRNQKILHQVYTSLFQDPTQPLQLPSHKKIYVLEQRRGLLGHGLSAVVAKEKRHLLAKLGVQLIDDVREISVQTDYVTYSRNNQQHKVVGVQVVIDCTGATGNNLAVEIIEDQRVINLYSNDIPGLQGLERSQELLIQTLLKIGALSYASEMP